MLICPLKLIEDEPVFCGTIPYIASSQCTPNCLQRHQVNEGGLLGYSFYETLDNGHLQVIT